MEVRRLISVVWSRLPILLLAVVAAAVPAFVLTNGQARVYEATATLLVGPSLAGSNLDANDLEAARQLAPSYVLLAKSEAFLDRVSNGIDPAITPQELAASVTVSADGATALVSVLARDGDPNRAAALANAVAAGLVAASAGASTVDEQKRLAIEANIAAVSQEIAATQSEIDRLTTKPVRSAEDSATLDALRSRQVTLLSAYVAITALSPSNAVNQVTLIQSAVSPDGPVAPRPLYFAVLAGVGALMLVFAAFYVMEYADDRVKSPRDVEAVTGLPTLGTIARSTLKRGRGGGPALDPMADSQSKASDGYRNLRLAIDAAVANRQVRTLLVTSPGQGEGRTATSANLAVAFAQAGRQVILVDADLRQPRIHVSFGITQVPGLTTMLHNPELTIDMVARHTGQDGLGVLPAGSSAQDPSRLFEPPIMRGFIERALLETSMIIFDAPSIRQGSEAVMLSTYCDATLLVVDTTRTHRPALLDACERLLRARTSVVGIALNRAGDGDRPESIAPGQYSQAEVRGQDVLDHAGRL